MVMQTPPQCDMYSASLEICMALLKRTLRNLTLKTPKTYGYSAVDSVRDTLLKTDYEPFHKSELPEMRRAKMAAVVSNEIEDIIRTPEQVALDEMKLDMRIRAGATNRYATHLWLELAMQPGSDTSRRFAYMRHIQGEMQTQRQYQGLSESL